MKIHTVGALYPDADLSVCRFAIVVTRWNPDIITSLLAGATRTLKGRGVSEDRIDVFTVPGAFEIPLMLDQLAATERYDALLALGAVIRGDTPHFDFVAGECAAGVRELGVRRAIPVGFGVLTTDNLEQAQQRAGSGDDNKGCEAADAAADMVAALRELHAK